MRSAEKIKATLAAAGLSYGEFAEILGLTRQTLYNYFKPETHLEDFENGVKCIDMSKKIWKLCEEKTLPFKTGVSGAEKIQQLKGLLGCATVKAQP